MTTPAKNLSNVDRLRKNLKDGSLALQLIDAHQKAKPADVKAVLEAVLQARLDQLRTGIDNPKA